MAAISPFSPFRVLPESPAEWMFDPPRLGAPVGPLQPNFPEDVLLVQQIVNLIIAGGYLDDLLDVPVPESGMWDFALENVLGDIEDKFLSGMASPLGPGIVAEDSALFAFLIHLVAGNADVISQYSGEMYHLASMMLPLGVHNGNIHRYLPYLLQALRRCGLADTDMVLMAFATIAAESARVAPIDEGPSRYNSTPAALAHRKGTHLFDRYDNRKDLGHQGAPDGSHYRGRGFIQLTGKNNYARYEKVLGIPLLQHPEIADQPWVAAELLAQFLKDHEFVIREALGRGDLVAARRAVNGGSHGLPEFQDKFETGRQFLRSRLAAEARGTAFSD